MDTTPGLDILGGSVLGVVLILLLGGWLWARPAVERLIHENERLGSENAHLRQGIEERMIPAVERSTLLAERVVELLDGRRETDRRIGELLDKLDREGRT